MVARVAIDLALDRLFDYEVPEALEGKLAVGQLLSVPFRHREARGFVMEVARSADSAVRALKPITAIVDETPFFSPSLIELARKVAEYTASPIESVLKAAVPAAVVRRNARAREQLFVEPALQGQGIGAKLLEYAVEHMGAQTLWALEQNAGAIRFYQRHGFRLTGERRLEDVTSEYLVRMQK